MPKYMKNDNRMKPHNSNPERGFKLGQRGISTIDIIIIIVASIIIIVSGIFLYTNFRTLKQVNEDIAEMKVIINEKQVTLDKLIELGQSEDVLKENYERNKMYVPETKDPVGIIADITGVVENYKGKFKTITYGAEVAKENGVIDVPFTIRVESTYDVLNDIVSGFNSTDRLYVIDSVTVIETSSEDILNAEIKMHAYYKGQ